MESVIFQGQWGNRGRRRDDPVLLLRQVREEADLGEEGQGAHPEGARGGRDPQEALHLQRVFQDLRHRVQDEVPQVVYDQ